MAHHMRDDQHHNCLPRPAKPEQPCQALLLLQQPPLPIQHLVSHNPLLLTYLPHQKRLPRLFHYIPSDRTPHLPSTQQPLPRLLPIPNRTLQRRMRNPNLRPRQDDPAPELLVEVRVVSFERDIQAKEDVTLAIELGCTIELCF